MVRITSRVSQRSGFGRFGCRYEGKEVIGLARELSETAALVVFGAIFVIGEGSRIGPGLVCELGRNVAASVRRRIDRLIVMQPT